MDLLEKDFTQEERDIALPFDTSDRRTLLLELCQSLPDVYQPEVKRAMRGAINKLAVMNDEEFEALGFDMFDYGFGHNWDDFE